MQSDQSAPDPPNFIPKPSVKEANEEKNLNSLQKLVNSVPNKVKRLYFSQERIDPLDASKGSHFDIINIDDNDNIPYSTFFHEEEDRKPTIIVYQNDTEDWIIQNQALEAHVFHIHQGNYLLLEKNGKIVNPIEHQLQDTTFIDAWSGNHLDNYPEIRIRLDFTRFQLGIFVFHCHNLEHEDLGMMRVIQVLPGSSSRSSSDQNQQPITATSLRGIHIIHDYMQFSHHNHQYSSIFQLISLVIMIIICLSILMTIYRDRKRNF